MIYGAQRTADFRRGRSGGSDANAASDLQFQQEMQLMNWDTSTRATKRGSWAYSALGQNKVAVPLKRGPARIVELRPKDGRPTLQKGIDVGFETGQIGQNEMALVVTNRPWNVRGGSKRTHEEIRAPGANLQLVPGHYVAKVGSLSASSGARQNPRLDIPGSRLYRLSLAGFKGDVYSGAEVNNADLTGAAITMKGGRQMLLHDAKTGNAYVNKQSLGATSEAAARHATDLAYLATDEMTHFPMPSIAATQRAATRHIVLGSRIAISNHLSAAAVAHMRSEMQANYGASRVKPEEPHYV